MRKLAPVLGIIFLFSIQSIWAEDYSLYPEIGGPYGMTTDKNFAIGIHFGYPWTQVEPKNGFTGGSAAMKTRDNFYAALVFRYNVCDWLFLGFNTEYTRLSTDTEGDEFDFNIISILAAAEFRHPTYVLYYLGIHENQTPREYIYLTTTLGVDMTHIESFEISTSVLSRDEEFPNFTCGITAGMEYFICSDVSLQLEAGWFYKEHNFEEEFLGSERGLKFTMNEGFRISLGSRIYF